MYYKCINRLWEKFTKTIQNNPQKIPKNFYDTNLFNKVVAESLLDFVLSCVVEIEKYGDFSQNDRGSLTSKGSTILKGVLWYNTEYFDSGYARDGLYQV